MHHVGGFAAIRTVAVTAAVAALAATAVPRAAGALAGQDPGALAPGAAERVLVVRGGLGTAGFLQGSTDQDLSDLFNERMTGFARFGAVLAAEGYEVTQLDEGPGGTKLDLGLADLRRYGLVVFASNNAAYGPGDADLVEAYVRGGGSALFLADANFGRDWRAAADSDQTFLDRFGLTISQDNAAPASLATSAFRVPDHPVLRGVDRVSGYGATAFTVTTVPGTTATILVGAVDPVRANSGDGKDPGPTRTPTAADAAVVVVEAGRGRVAGTFDRDTFFPAPLAEAGNRIYTVNLVRWLTGR